MTAIKDLHDVWMRNPEYRARYDALEHEFAFARALIAARIEAGLTREALAARMGLSPGAIARIEAGQTIPSTTMLRRIARATGTRLRISFEPDTPTSRTSRSG